MRVEETVEKLLQSKDRFLKLQESLETIRDWQF